MDWLDLLAVQGTLKSLLQHHSSKASTLWHSAFFLVQLSHPYMTTGKTIALIRLIFVDKVVSLLFNMLPRLVITFLSRSSSSAAQLCLTLCGPMNHSMPGLPLSITNSHSLPKPMSIESVMPSNHLILCHPFLLLPPIFPSIRVFPMSQLFISDGQSIGVSASTSVLPMSTQDLSLFRMDWLDLLAVQGTLKSLL